MKRTASAIATANALLVVVVTMLAAGCHAKYVTPGGPADLSAFSDRSVAEKWDRKPAAAFPARIALIRVQASGYRSHRHESFGYGNYSVVTARDVETEAHLKTIAAVPDVADVATINRLLLPEHLQSDLELRDAAASLHADMLLLYTFDTVFRTDKAIPAADVLTLGLMPDRSERVTTTASALLMDTRTGFIYATLEATARQNQLANAWSSADAADDARVRAERQAFDELVAQFEPTWHRVRSEHARPSASAARP